MRVVALISGGKDSCYNMMQCEQNGHEIVALANLKPASKDELDSYMYQTVGHQAIDMYAEAMGLPLYRRTIQGSSVEIGMNYVKNDQDEVEDLYELLLSIKSDIEFDAVSVGAILSDYQRIRVEHVCSRLGISCLAYLWRRDQRQLYEEMIANGLVAIIIKVAVMGLEPNKHLGLTMKEICPVVSKLHSQFGMNICGEGGEYETFTLDCPLFKKRIVVDESKVVIHSDDAFAPVGFLQLNALHLEDKLEEPERSLVQTIKALPKAYCGDPIENIPDIVTNTDSKYIDNAVSISLTEKQEHFQEQVLHNETSGYLWISGLKGYKQEDLTVQQITQIVMDKLKDKITLLNSSLDDVVLMQLFVKNMNDFSKINSVYKCYFPSNPPARACIEANLEEDCLLQLDCLLYRLITPSKERCRSQSRIVDDNIEISRHTREAMHVQSISHWASANIGPYSQVIKVGPLMFISGNIGLWPASMTMMEGGIVVEAALSLRHVDRIISAFSNSTQSLLNGCYGFCYVTRYQDIETAEEALKKAIQSKVCETINDEDNVVRLVSYIVVPSLPKNALVEWQFVSHHDIDQWKGLSSSINCDDTELKFQGLYYQDSLSTCAAINCDIVPLADARVVHFDKVFHSYIQELKKICARYGIGLQNVLTIRMFYVKQALQDTTENDLYSCTRRALEQLNIPAPAFVLLPVDGLKGRAFLSLSCWFQT